MAIRILRVIVAIGILTAMPGCEKNGVPTSPSETVTFIAQLSPANTVPPVTNAEALSTGTAIVGITVIRDSAGAITSASASIQVHVTGLPAAATITKVHLHGGPPGANGLVVLDVTFSAGDFRLNLGAGEFSRSGLSISSALALEILSFPSGFYADVHTLLNPDGLARGQLARQ
jgi:hypothetical protein